MHRIFSDSEMEAKNEAKNVLTVCRLDLPNRFLTDRAVADSAAYAGRCAYRRRFADSTHVTFLLNDRRSRSNFGSLKKSSV